MIRTIVVLVLLSSLPAWAIAQTNTAEISGVVHDVQGGVLPGATVIARHVASGVRIVRVSDQAGQYHLPALPVGEYVVTVELQGFRQFAQRGLVLRVGQKIDLPITLQIGQLTDFVTVTGEAPLLQTANAEVADIIEGGRLVAMPLNGRQFVQLAQLSDGVVVPPGGTRGAALEQAGALPAVAGQRNGHNIYLLDGVKVTDEFFNNLVISPPLDSIQEFKIQKTMYSAEFGGKASALINVVTKSGSNMMRGSALEFLRHDRLDARNAFDDPNQPVPPLRQHQFGANVGGPIARDRTFFFISYEGQRVHRSLTQTFSVPTDNLRHGDFSTLAPLCDPLTREAGGSCVAFAGSRIPAERLDRTALALLAHVPGPNRAGLVQNLLSVGVQETPMDQFSIRVDHRFSPVHSLFGRFSTYDVSDRQPFGTSALNETLAPGFGRTITTRSRNLAISYTRSLGETMLNELRFGYLSASGGQVSPNQGIDFAAESGLRGVTQDPRDMGYPQVSFGGLFNTIGDPSSFVARDNRSYEVYDNILVDRGRHHLKFGGYLFRLEFNPVNPAAARGAFTFTGQWTGNAFADFLLGYPSSGQVGIGRADEHGRSTWLHVYGQDDWRVRDGVMMNYGLRYEINGQMNDIDHRLSAVDLTVPGGRFVIASDDDGRISPSGQTLLPQIPIPYVTSEQARWTSGLLRPSYRRFAPRVGVAWTVNADTVVTAGFGVFLNQWAYSVQQALAQSLPFFFNKTVNAASDAVRPTFTTDRMLLADANGTVGGNTMNHDYQTEYAKNWTISLQRQVWPSAMVEASYLHSNIVGADSSTVLNVPEPGPGPIGPRRPVPSLANITTIRWDGDSRYDSLTIKAEQRLRRGLSFSANYTLSKSMDDASDPGATAFEVNLPQDVRNMAAERARSSFDHRHRFVGSLAYALPDRLFGGGWRLNGIVTLQSGAPFTVNLGTDRANIGSGPAQRPDVSGDPNEGGAQTAEQWFNTSVFSLPAPFAFGNSGRNIVQAPGYGDVDAAVQKDIQLPKGARIELRWEIFNLFDRVNFDVPNRTAFTPNFGRIFSAGAARQMQLGMKVVF